MLNRIILIGRLTADPEMRYTQAGVPIASFRLAVDRTFKDASGQKQTDFINIVAWRKTAELVGEYLKKGQMAAVEGSLQMRQYMTKEGENRTVYEVNANNVQFLERGRGGEERGSEPVTYEQGTAVADEDELPF